MSKPPSPDPRATTGQDGAPRPPDNGNQRTNQLMEAFWGFGQLMRQYIIPSVIGEYGLDFKDFITLISISEGARYPKLICSRLHTNPSDVSRILEALAKHGLIARELDPQDSRRVRVSLTPSGEDLLERAKARLQDLMSFAEQSLPTDEMVRFSNTLIQLQRVLSTRLTDLGLTPPPGDHCGWFGHWGTQSQDSS